MYFKFKALDTKIITNNFVSQNLSQIGKIRVEITVFG